MSIVEIGLASVILYFAILVVTEPVQRYLYDDVVSGLWWRSAVAAVPLAALLVALPLHFNKMFTEKPHYTLAHMAIWPLLMCRPIRFLIPHAIFVGILLAVLLGPLVTMGLDSYLKRVVSL